MRFWLISSKSSVFEQKLKLSAFFRKKLPKNFNKKYLPRFQLAQRGDLALQSAQYLLSSRWRSCASIALWRSFWLFDCGAIYTLKNFEIFKLIRFFPFYCFLVFFSIFALFKYFFVFFFSHSFNVTQNEEFKKK